MAEDNFQTACQTACAEELPLGGLVTAAAQLAAQDKVSQARQLYRSWIDSNSNDPQLHIALFNCAALDSQQGDDQSAETALRRAIALSPDFLPAHINLGSVLERAGRRHALIDLSGRRLRVGYVSSDLRDHAIGYLMAELFELHDRSRIEVFAYYCGTASESPLHARIRGAVEHWTCISGMSDDEAAAKIAGDGVDVLVDVNGHTRDARTGVFARRPAPIQVNWLGYPGTMATPYHQYIIADQVIIPPEAELYYSEKVVRIPCYQPNDRKRQISSNAPSRAEAGLPEDAFVYCSFNALHKLTRFTFQRWMTILQRTPKSVLWLLEGSDEAKRRLREFAAQNGIGPERIVFAPKKANPDHLARYRLADLFLDTTPYGAHTTASDALWMGVPVLTAPGRCFASRVCASLVCAAGLPDLVCAGAEDYVERAVTLANNPAIMSALRQRLAQARNDCQLFDTGLVARSLEDLYGKLCADQAQGIVPQPDLANLDAYLDVGVAIDHDASEAGMIADYHGYYKDRLAWRHRRRPLSADRRLWTASDIALADQRPATPPPEPANDAEPDIDAMFARIFSDNGNIPLLQLRDIHDVASAILCRRLDMKAAQQLDRLLDAANRLAVPTPPGSEWQSWEKHYRLLISGIDLKMVVSPTQASDPTAETAPVTTSGSPLSWMEVRARAEQIGARAVFFSAADENYITQYARWYLRSILKYADIPFLIVTHVIGGAERLSDIARSVGIDDERIIFTGDHFNANDVTTQCFDAPPNGRSEHPIAHFQSMRFFHAGDVLQNLELPIFVSDIDLLLQRGVSDLITRHAGMDLVLNENRLSKAAGSRLTANLLLLFPAANTESFLCFLCAYLDRALSQPEVTRWVDQLGLILARHHLAIRYPDTRIGYFDTNTDINNVMYRSYQKHPFRFLSLYHGFDMSSLQNNSEILGDGETMDGASPYKLPRSIQAR